MTATGSRSFSGTVIDAPQLALGESPLWAPGRGLYWLDVLGQQLCQLAGDVVRVTTLNLQVSAVELGPAEALLAVVPEHGFGRLDAASGVVDALVAAPLVGSARMNDGAIDPLGRCWAGSATHDDSRVGQLYRLADGQVTTHVSGIGMSNGLDWSPDGRTLYHADSLAGTVTAYLYDVATGALADGRVVLQVWREVGLPDGLTVDTEGAVWVAMWGPGEVWRVDPHSGERLAVVHVPTPNTTSCAFGGEQLDILYITTAHADADPRSGRLYQARVGQQGMPPRRYAGML